MDRWADFYGIIEDYRNAHFVWGEKDCCLFAADCIEVLTGVDYMAAYRGKYRTKREAMGLIGQDLEENLDRLFVRYGGTFPARGMIAMWQNACGVCDVGYALFMTASNGLTAVRYELCDAFWKVK